MQTHHDQELDGLKDKLLTMASLAETSLIQAVKALIDRDEDLAKGVRKFDRSIDRLEIDIDETAVVLLSKAPLARDLRFIIVAMKISNDLERVGDEAKGIAKQAIKLNEEPQLKPYVDIPRMADLALKMLKTALDAFISGDVNKVQQVLEQDEEVDSLHKQLQRELVSYVLEAPSNITRILAIGNIAKRIERIADHATNIAEEAVYLHQGRHIRHEAAQAEVL
jgi:phosphate transport system protein